MFIIIQFVRNNIKLSHSKNRVQNHWELGHIGKKQIYLDINKIPSDPLMGNKH